MRHVVRWLLSVLSFLLLTAGTAFAQTNRWGEWFTGAMPNSSGFFAATFNDSRNGLGQYCYLSSGSCLYILAAATPCKDGDKYPALINSDAGSLVIEIICNGYLTALGRYQYVITPFDDIDRIVKQANRVGFAFALQSDAFTVTRFSLSGSNEAIASMRTIAEAATRLSPGGRQRTVDERL